jgi:hypothetical protein
MASKDKVKKQATYLRVILHYSRYKIGPTKIEHAKNITLKYLKHNNNV